MAEIIKVLIVDDHAVVRMGLKAILGLEKDIEVVGEAEDGREGVSKALELKPNIILMDIYMPGATGLEALAAIREKLPSARVLLMTVSDREQDLFTALRYGAQGYILKGASIRDISSSVRTIAAGGVILSPDLAVYLVAEFRKTHSDEHSLTDREQEILQMIGEGLTNAEIAARLFIGETTVRTHLQRLLYKLQLKNRAEAIAYSQRRCLAALKH